MKYLRLAALIWGIRGLEGEDYAKLFNAAIEGASKWARQEENKKALKSLAETCVKGYLKHLSITKGHEKNSSD